MNMSVEPSAAAGSGPEATPVLAVKNIEVVYNHVILVLRGVSLKVPQGGIVSLLGANGAGKSTTLKSVSTLLAQERGAVTKGSIEFRGRRTDQLTPGALVAMGMVQVMEGRRIFASRRFKHEGAEPEQWQREQRDVVDDEVWIDEQRGEHNDAQPNTDRRVSLPDTNGVPEH